MRRLIATTAVALVIAGPGFAQEQTQGATTGREATGDAQMQVGGAGAAGGDFYTANPSDFLGSALMGAAVYAPSADAAEPGRGRRGARHGRGDR
jgi:hypothetical protein